MNYELLERIAIMDLQNSNSNQVERFAKIDLDHPGKSFSDLEWSFILSNTDVILLALEDLIKNGWTPLDLFGVYKEHREWKGVLFSLPPKAKIIKVDRMFIDYIIPDSIKTYHLIKTYNFNAKLFWEI